MRVALEIDEDYADRHEWGIVFGDMDIDTSTAVGKMQLSSEGSGGDPCHFSHTALTASNCVRVDRRSEVDQILSRIGGGWRSRVR